MPFGPWTQRQPPSTRSLKDRNSPAPGIEARDRACEGSDSTPPDIPADGSYADPSPHRARLDFEDGAGAGAPRGPVDDEVEEEGEKPMPTPPTPTTCYPDVTPSSPDDDSDSSEDSVVGRGTVPPDRKLVDALSDDSSDGNDSL